VTMSGEATGANAARKRAAVEIVSRYEPALRRTARRYSLCADDAEDAFQRALEILLTKAPTTDPRELIRWTQTVTKHEALAVRRSREQAMGRAVQVPGEDEPVDWVALIPAEGAGPEERAERREAIARNREAMRALKPAERRALSLLAGGCSYTEIARITGFSATKVNRCIAEGRERFRRVVAGSEDGSRCAELRPLLSALCDGEIDAEQARAMRDHLRACGPCRAALRAYRAAPRAIAALAPAPFALGALLERAQAAFAKLTATTKAAAVSAGTAAVGTACVVTGVVPAPLPSTGESQRAAIERSGGQSVASPAAGAGASREPARRPQRKAPRRRVEGEAAASSAQPPVEYAPAPEAAPPAPEPPPEAAPALAPPSPPATPSGDSAAGEFGP
jgi:RNA polymerase sigma factor (sigma-70 family)